MKIIISPAKKMKVNTDSFAPKELPYFIEEAETLLRHLKQLDYEQLKKLWACSDKLARMNFERIQDMDLRSGLTPAILSYEGIQYQYMGADIFDDQQYEFVNDHLRILSGFYGSLRPFDGVSPYRLEMQARLKGASFKNLYAFWGNKLAKKLSSETDFILNLASKEYSKAVSGHLPNGFFFLTCVFGQLKNNKVLEKGTMCKMARGEMVRFLAENQITDPEDIKAFNSLDYRFSKEHSQPDHFVFLKNCEEINNFT